ncbi:MAG: hypothetical protein J07HQX50_01651 [Haloquadratum sp. J07HQX50]|nr:MAG: hypothetical protein J07HQX50_01651 [Haloquadratum sp. J07HQX50]
MWLRAELNTKLINTTLIPEETPPDIANPQAEQSVDWVVARCKKLAIAGRDVDTGIDDWANSENDPDDTDE